MGPPSAEPGGSAQTCKRLAEIANDVEPYAYLHDVLTRMVHGHPIKRLDELLPWQRRDLLLAAAKGNSSGR
jgi:hypothetical protein